MRPAGLFFALLLAAMSFSPAPVRGAAPSSCGIPDGDRQTFTGTFGAADRGSYLMVPFEVPAGATRVRVRLCHDQIDAPVPGQAGLKHTLDLGVYDALRPGNTPWGAEEFRGWGGSSRLDVLITREGSNVVDATKTTVGFKPGPIPAGTWAAEIGVAAIAETGDADGLVAWRLDVYTRSDSADEDDPWTPAPYDATPATSEPGWYAGDMHVHAKHSNPSDATMADAFGYAFSPAGANLDFVTLSDYVTDRHWDEIHRPEVKAFIPPGKLVIRSAEVITYRGHINNHASRTWVDHRTGPVYLLGPDNMRTSLRAATPPSAVFDAIHASGSGWTQVNHPTTFPSKVPPFALQCRGCSWEYDDLETRWDKVDAFEVQTGPAGYYEPRGNEPGPNPFTPAAIEWWDRLRRAGHDITAVGVSDSHRAAAQDLTFSPIGEATTVVYAPELSEAGIRAGVLAGHAYVKFFSANGPDLRLDAASLAGTGPPVMMGDSIAGPAMFTAKVFNLPEPEESPVPRTLLVFYEGFPIMSVPVPPEGLTFDFAGGFEGDYRIQLMRGSAIEALTNPITICPATPPLLPVHDDRCE